MPAKISQAQLNGYQDLVTGGKIGEFYDIMNSQRYKYAGWANGVAQGSSISGNSALDFLAGTAMVGIGGAACRNLSRNTIDSVRKDMAQGYLDTRKDIAAESDGYLSRDVNAKEVYDFHEVAFNESGLTIDNWTLKVPFDIIKNKKGEQGLEDFWVDLRDTVGSGPLALMKSL